MRLSPLESRVALAMLSAKPKYVPNTSRHTHSAVLSQWQTSVELLVDALGLTLADVYHFFALLESDAAVLRSRAVLTHSLYRRFYERDDVVGH